MSTRKQVIESCQERIQILQDIIKSLDEGWSMTNALAKAGQLDYALSDEIRDICTVMNTDGKGVWVDD